MKGYRRASAVIIGMVFLLAGILKLMDPVGTGLIVREYFSFFHAGFMNFSSGVLAVFLFWTFVTPFLITKRNR